MPTVSIDWGSVGSGVFQFLSYMGLAVFAENVILSRALGVTRLLKLVPDHKAQIWNFALPLILVMTLSAPFGWLAHNVLFIWLRTVLLAWLPLSALRPVVYLSCGVAAMGITWLLLLLLPHQVLQNRYTHFPVQIRRLPGFCNPLPYLSPLLSAVLIFQQFLHII